jgi:hypothetical protein
VADLSPAAQAIAWAYDNAPEKPTDNHRYYWLAAALRAAADQVQMNKPLGDTDADAGVFAAHHAIRAHFLAIAAELEGANG